MQQSMFGFNGFIKSTIATTPTAAVQIDTIKAGERKIDYPATGHVGLTTTSTRTVMVAAPQAANDTTASSTHPAANDNSVTTSSATSTGM